MTPDRYLHEGDSVSGATNSGVCVSPTTPRGARELTGTMSRASNANENLAQCGDNAGQNNKPDKHSASDATLSNKSDNECLPSVPNDQHDILISENMASNVKSFFPTLERKRTAF